MFKQPAKSVRLSTERVLRSLINALFLSVLFVGPTRADYFFSEFNEIARYSDNGRPIPAGFEVVYPEYGPESYFEEAVYGITLGSNDKIYAHGESVGSITVHEFDPLEDTSSSPKGLTQSSVFGNRYDEMLLSSLVHCQFGSELCFGPHTRMGRIHSPYRALTASDDGYLYGEGPIELWAADFRTELSLILPRSGWGIHRLDTVHGGPPELVFPLTFSQGSFVAPFDWRINENNDIELRTEHGVVDYMIPESPFPRELKHLFLTDSWPALELNEEYLLAKELSQDPENDAEVIQLKAEVEALGDDPFGWFSPDAPGLRPADPLPDTFDPGPLPEFQQGYKISSEFQDDKGNTLLLLSRFSEGRYPRIDRQKLLEFDTESARLKRVVFEHDARGFPGPLSGGLYVRTVPEPSSGFLILILLSVINGRRTHRRLA